MYVQIYSHTKNTTSVETGVVEIHNSLSFQTERTDHCRFGGRSISKYSSTKDTGIVLKMEAK